MAKIALTLYITGDTQNSAIAKHNMQQLCNNELKDRCELTVVNILENPQLAEANNVVATPMLIKERPAPVRAVIGDLSDGEKIIDLLHLKRNRR